MKINKHKILIDIDSIIDTRLGALTKSHPKLVPTVLEGDKWHVRWYDNLEQFGCTIEDTQKWLKEYENRDKTTLRQSPPSLIFKFIRDYIEKYLTSENTNRDTGLPTIYLNTEPYNLINEEIDDFVNIVKINTACGSVEAVQIKSITVDVIRKYDVIITYDYHTVLENIGEDTSVLKEPLVEHLLVIPAVYKNKQNDISEEEMMSIMEASISPVISCIILPPGWFSSTVKVQNVE